MKMFFMALSLPLLVAGCVAGQVAPETDLPNKDKAIVVMGVTVNGVHPEEAKLYLDSGSFDHGKFAKSYYYGAQFAASPINGYIVGEVDTKETTGLGAVKVNFDQEAVAGLSESGSSDFIPSEGTMTVAFAAAGGEVVYVGDITLDVTPPKPHTLESGTLVISRTFNFDAARDYVDAHYPALRGPLTGESFKVVPYSYPGLGDLNPLVVAHRVIQPKWTWRD